MSCNNNILTGKGTKFYIYDGIDWVAIANVSSLTALDINKTFIEVTSINSVNGYNEYRPSFKEAGEIKVSMLFEYSNLALFKDRFDSDIMHDYKIVFADEVSTTFLFTGGVSKIPISVNVNEVIKMDISFKLTGEVDIVNTP